MNWISVAFSGAAGGLLLAGAAQGMTNEPGPSERDYRVIIDRNPFGLKPPPPPPTNAPPPVEKKDEILLTGITSIGGLRAYFMTKAPQGKNPEFYSLSVDEKKNGLEILEIDPKSKSVRVRNSGAESLMTFAANGVKPPATTTGPTPASPAVPGTQPSPVPATLPGAPPPFASAPASVPGRTRTIPSRNTRVPPPPMGGMSSPTQPAPAPNVYSAEQEVLLMELQKRANPNVVFPPTPMPP